MVSRPAARFELEVGMDDVVAVATFPTNIQVVICGFKTIEVQKEYKAHIVFLVGLKASTGMIFRFV